MFESGTSMVRDARMEALRSAERPQRGHVTQHFVRDFRGGTAFVC